MYIFGHFPVLKLNNVGGPKTEKSTGAKYFYLFPRIENTLKTVSNQCLKFN